MYTQSSIVYRSARCQNHSKGVKASRLKTNYFCDQFNHLSRNKDHFSPDEFFNQIRDLTEEYIAHAATQKPKKMQFEDVLAFNLALGNNLRNKKIVLYHIKLAELYLKSQIDLSILLKSINSINQFHLLQTNFHQYFCINLTLLNSIQNQKLRQTIQKAVGFLFKFIDIQQNESHQNFINLYLSQSVITENFAIFFQITCAYYQRLRQRPFNYPFIDVNFVLKKFFDFDERRMPQFEQHYRHILNKYFKLFDIQQYFPFLMRDFQSIFLLITQWTDSNPSKQNQFMVIYFHNILIDLSNRGVVISIPQISFQTQEIRTSGQKLHFFMSFYLKNFKNLEKKSLSQIDLEDLKNYFTTIQKNIENLMIPDHNFIRVVDKIVNEVQKIKRNFLKETSTSDKMIILKNQKNLHAIEVLTQLVGIQNIIISNKIYLALDNFKNSSYFATSGIIDIMIQSFSSTRQDFIDSILKKWVNKIALLNLELSDLETFYSTLINFLTKKYKQNLQNPEELSFLFKCFSFFVENIPTILSSNFQVLNCWHYIIIRVINYFSQKNSNQIELSQSIDQIQIFIKKFTSSLCKNTFTYFENIHQSGQSMNSLKDDQIFNHQKDLISYSVILFCLNHELLTSQDIKNFLKIFTTSLQKQKIGEFDQILRKDIAQKIQAYIFMTIQNRKACENEIDFLQMEFFLNIYRKLIKTDKDKKEIRNNYSSIYTNLRSINFIFNLKNVIGQVKDCHSLKELIQNFQQSIIGSLSHTYIDRLFDQDAIQEKCKQKYLEIMLDVLVKKIYFTTHPQIRGYENFNNSNDKTGFAEVDESKQGINAPQQNTKRQKRQKQQKQFQRSIINFENSCIIIGKAKNLLTKTFNSLKNIIAKFDFKTEHNSNLEFLSLKENEFSNFQNISNLLGFTWNILWMLKICDMPKQLSELLKLRLGIFNYFSCLTKNQALFSFQLEKLAYFELIDTNKRNQQEKSFPQKLLRNKVAQSQIGNIKSRMQYIIYLFNNLSSSKSFKNLITYVSAFIFDCHKINQDTLSKAKVNFFPFFQPVPIPKRTNLKIEEKQFLAEFLNFDPTQIVYPLMTKIIRKLIFFVKKNNQISQIRALLSLITCYFSKIGLGIYYDEIVDLWLIKNVKISILKVIDCYQIFLNNSLRNQQQNQSSDKLKIFSKIDRMLCNKRRSVSTYFTLKNILDLLNQIRNSELPMHFNICQIIMKQFKQQFNLYNYEAQVIINNIYPNKISNIFNGENIEQSKMQKFWEIAKKVVLQKQFFKNYTQQTFNYAYQSLIFLKDSIIQFVLINFETGKIAQSLIGYFIEFIEEFSDSDFKPKKFEQALKCIDQTLIKLALTMLQFNYEYKSCVYESSDVQDMRRSEITTLFHQLEKNKIIFGNFYQKFESGIQSKLKFLIPSQKRSKSNRDSGQKLKYPLSIIYPLRNFVYNIAIIDSMMITKVDMFNFDHSLSKIEQFIDNDSEIIFKQKSAKDWWKGRIRLDREMGKIAQSTDLGVFDVKVEDHLQLRSCLNKNLSKLIYSDSQQTNKHIKTLLQKQNIDLTKQSQILSEINKMQQLLMVNLGLNDGIFKIDQSILILTVNRLSIFPFEKIKSLQRYSGTYRVPSVKYIIQQQKLRQRYSPSYSIKNLSYAVNIHNDLKKTERKFLEIKESISKKTCNYLQWQGVIGKEPCKSQYQSYFLKQVYVYMGHGSGMSHIKQRQLYRTNINSILMLFGCSSINMDHRCSEQHGIPLILLKNNCPALLGSKWEITDIDTDLLTTKIFEKIITEKQIDMSVCLQQAKKSMKLSNLNGCAIVVYGLPCKLFL